MSSPIHIGLMMHGGAGWLGGAYYIENLYRAIVSLPSDERQQVRVTLLGTQLQFARLGSVADTAEARVVLDSQPSPDFWLTQQFRWQRLVQGHRAPWFDRMVAREQIDFIYPHSPSDHGSRRFKSAAWQPDFQHREMPHMFSQEEISQRDAVMIEAQEYADRIVLSSESAREQCAKHFPAASEKVSVLRFASVLGPSARFEDTRAAADRYHLPERFFILSNQFWRHKNHMLVWEALALLRQRGSQPVLVCTGHTHDYRHPGHFDNLLDRLHRDNLSSQIRILGVVPRELQLLLMRRAVAVVQPSLFEGWSTAVEDARALGCKMILSDIDSHKEQAPVRAQYYAAHDRQSLADELQKAWESPSEPGRDSPVATDDTESQGERVRQFARQFIVLAREAVGRQ